MGLACLKKALRVFIFIGVANFLTFAIISCLIGGDAQHGRVRDGHYFLEQKGRFTEVSHSAFTYSRRHGDSVFLTLPLVMLAGMLLEGLKTPEEKREEQRRRSKRLLGP